MAVEKMEMLNLVAPLDKMESICKDVVLSENIHIVNALNEINESNFTLCVLEDNIDELMDMCVIKSYKEEFSYKEAKDKIDKLVKMFGVNKPIKEMHLEGEYDFSETLEEVNEVFKAVNNIHSSKEELEEEREVLSKFSNHIKHIQDVDLDLSVLDDLYHFNYKIGVLSKDNRIKLKKNYENISAVVFHIGSDPSGEVYLIISPTELETETNRILRSLNFQELKVNRRYSGTPKEIFTRIGERIVEIDKNLNRLNKSIDSFRDKYVEKIERAYSRIRLQEKINKVKNETAYTSNFFYLSGWAPTRDKQKLEEKFKSYGHEVILMFKDVDQVYKYMIPPTKLRNNRITKPFEVLVNMYGIPSYDELDPTLFLGLTYMLLFGAMFGDVGQGLVIFLAGLILQKRMENKLYGGILTRLGLSSTVFGFLYGSVFGFEHVVPALLIHPIENINSMLVGSIVIGVIFLIMSFGYNIINCLKQGNIQNGVFGRNGINGLIFYLSLLTLVVKGFIGLDWIPSSLLIAIILISIVLMVVREPLTNLIEKKRPLYHEGASAYYVESSFDIFETFLNTLSNTVSFIRVGAFALNHVGLFIAFQTMARIMNNFAGSIIIFIIGNIIVLCLEGLIVFIQGLRLEYYELFSKYYRGEGVEFKPIKLAE